jgi:hypothetical protein
MLIQKIVGTADAALVGNAFGFRAAKSYAIGCRLFFRPLAGGAFPELSHIDQIPHAGLRHAIRRGGMRMRPPKGMPAIREKLQVLIANAVSKVGGHVLVSSVVI